ncbi:hypothetical protein C7U60_16105 [Mesorhizobium plurifarium]|nr:hypothetical protein C7U60_16105 [Mesorhizobium plurifarium]
MGIGRNARSVVILWRSKERSDAARCHDAEFCSSAPYDKGHGMDPRVCAPLRVAPPVDDDVTEAAANLEGFS